jgi:hypothetical protein
MIDQKNLSFRTAFKATMGFYLAQAVATLIGIALLGIVATATIFIVRSVL